MTNSKKILKNKKGLIALVLTGAMLLSLTACAGKKDWDDTNESVQPDVTQGNTIEADASFIDYAGELKLNMNSESVKQEVSVKSYVDGDTTHFNVPE